MADSNPTPKTCSKCKRIQTVNDFHCDQSRADGLQYNCKDCERIRGREKERRYRERRKELWNMLPNDHPIKERHRARFRGYYHQGVSYGLTSEQVAELRTRQADCCAICGCDLAALPRKNVHIDHCHATGLVRGILCRGCNSLLGNACDSPDRLLKAAEYLDRSLRPMDTKSRLYVRRHPKNPSLRVIRSASSG